MKDMHPEVDISSFLSLGYTNIYQNVNNRDESSSKKHENALNHEIKNVSEKNHENKYKN